MKKTDMNLVEDKSVTYKEVVELIMKKNSSASPDKKDE